MSYVTETISIDGIAPVLAQHDPRDRWNGWLCPRIDAWSVELVLSALEGDDSNLTHEWLEGHLLVHDGYDDEETWTEDYEPDADGLYALGAYGWVWSAHIDDEARA